MTSGMYAAEQLVTGSQARRITRNYLGIVLKNG